MQFLGLVKHVFHILNSLFQEQMFVCKDDEAMVHACLGMKMLSVGSGVWETALGEINSLKQQPNGQ